MAVPASETDDGDMQIDAMLQWSENAISQLDAVIRSDCGLGSIVDPIMCVVQEGLSSLCARQISTRSLDWIETLCFFWQQNALSVHSTATLTMNMEYRTSQARPCSDIKTISQARSLVSYSKMPCQWQLCGVELQTPLFDGQSGIQVDVIRWTLQDPGQWASHTNTYARDVLLKRLPDSQTFPREFFTKILPECMPIRSSVDINSPMVDCTQPPEWQPLAFTCAIEHVRLWWLGPVLWKLLPCESTVEPSDILKRDMETSSEFATETINDHQNGTMNDDEHDGFFDDDNLAPTSILLVRTASVHMR